MGGRLSNDTIVQTAAVLRELLVNPLRINSELLEDMENKYNLSMGADDLNRIFGILNNSVLATDLVRYANARPRSLVMVHDRFHFQGLYSLEIHLTDQCPLRCEYCYYYQDGGKRVIRDQRGEAWDSRRWGPDQSG